MSALVERIIFARDSLNGLNISDYGIIRQARHVLADAANAITEMERDLHAYRETMRVIAEGGDAAPTDQQASKGGTEASADCGANTKPLPVPKGEEEIARALEALEPFASAHDEALEKYPEAGSAYVLQEACSLLSWPDFQVARALLAQTPREAGE